MSIELRFLRAYLTGLHLYLGGCGVAVLLLANFYSAALVLLLCASAIAFAVQKIGAKI